MKKSAAYVLTGEVLSAHSSSVKQLSSRPYTAKSKETPSVQSIFRAGVVIDLLENVKVRRRTLTVFEETTNKKHIVRLTDDERRESTEFVQKQKGKFQQVRRAQILLKADADGPGWIDEQIAAAFDCNPRVVAEIRKRFFERGLE